MEVQVWVSRSSREWKCWCESRNKQYKDGSAGGSRKVEMAVQVWKQKQQRWQCGCRSLNRRDKSADVRAEAVKIKGRPGVGAKQSILNMQMWEQKQQRFKWRSGRERGKDGTTGSFLDAATDEAE